MSTMLDNWTNAANVYGLLARLWIREIDKPTLEQFSGNDFQIAWTSLGGWIPSTVAADETIDALAIEYCSCFLGPKGHLPPHQSVVSHSRFQGDCLGSVRKFVDVIGMPEGKWFADQQMLDHAGLLLALMQRICFSAELYGDTEIKSLTELRARFFVSHLKWLNEYCQVAKQKTESKFYRGLFEVTREFLAGEESE